MIITEELICGAYDLHIHCAPDILPRKMNDIEMAQRIVNSGMAGYCMKSHYFCTSERAELINEWYPSCDAVGAICLNSSVGGLNPAAVEIAARSGARIVWMPTCDSEYERNHMAGEKPERMPFWAKIIQEMADEGIAMPAISIVDSAGRLKPELHKILDIVAQHNMVLATGHISKAEAFALVEEASMHGVQRMVITHADFPSTFYTIEEQQRLVEMGAYIEHCYTTYATGKVDFSVTVEQIRAISPKHVIISTDLGQKSNIYPDEGMLNFATQLYESGFSKSEIHTMNRDNPGSLVGR